ncbi:phage terminase small subunit P27 family, partial [Morganella morganii]|uniref:phage terminase small subunit P27 family n=2 Tax=Morganella morganii TaxID=582 RepID=UPI003EB6CE9B
MPGPPKTPSHLRLVRGNPSKRPINKKEPKPPSGVPPTPKHFTKQGKYWFKRIGEELNAMGVMSSMDAKALELLIEAYTEYRQHCDTLDEEGYTYTTQSDGGPLIKAHPVLMNPLMILVKIIKLRWIHILSYDQMVSRKINNQTTRCANSIF